MKTINKWIERCWGWMGLAGLALAAFYGYNLHTKIGYGTLAIQLKWQGKPYPIDQTDLASAELRIRGQRERLLPESNIRLRPGATSIELKLKRFTLCSLSPVVVKDQRVVAELNLEAEPQTITIQNTYSNVVVNGELCGPAWVIRNAVIGRKYEVSASAPGFHTNILYLTINNPGENLTTNLTLQPLMGWVSIRLNPETSESAVTLDGAPAPADLAAGNLLLAGWHTLEVSNADYYLLSRQFDVKHSQTNLLAITLKPKPASLSLEVKPAIQYQLHEKSGKVLMAEDGTAKLPPGEHTLSVTAKGYATQTKDFVMAPNQQYSWRVEMERAGLHEFTSRQVRFEKLKKDANPEILDKFGGTDWSAIKQVTFDKEDYEHGARQYQEVCDAMARLLETLPERGRVWTNAIRSSIDIDYWIVMEEFDKVKNKMLQFQSLYGPGTDYDRWFGGYASRVKTWQETIQQKQKYVPGKK